MVEELDGQPGDHSQPVDGQPGGECDEDVQQGIAEATSAKPAQCDETPQPGAAEATSAKAAQPLFNYSQCMYDVVIATAKSKGFRAVRTEAKIKAANVHWIDNCSYSDWFARIEPWMRINHFPGMFNALARKSRLARNLSRMQRLFPSEFNFLPETYIVPDDLQDLSKKFDDVGQSKVMYIAKPDAGTQGRGIFLFNSIDRLKKGLAEKDSSFVVQRYISRPMLIEGLKFDLRLYLLVCAHPGAAPGQLVPRYYLHRDGLVRLCTTEYVAPTAENINQRMMHLTNYAINKKSKDFVQNEGDDDGAGSKRSLRWFFDEFLVEECGEKERDKLWNKLKGLCVKMLLAVHPTLEAEYFTAFPRDFCGGHMGCRSFSIIGVDVMVDRKYRPYLIEINHLPSFTCDAGLDEDIKSRVVSQSMDIVCSQLSGEDRNKYEALVAQMQSEQVGVADAGSADTAPGNGWLLDAESYEDFVRVYPAAADAPKLAARYESIFSRVREVFRPVASMRAKRPSSAGEKAAGPAIAAGYVAGRKEPAPAGAGPRLPPRLPGGRAAATGGPETASSPSCASQGAPIKLGPRSRSAPARPPGKGELNTGLPGLPRCSGSPTPPRGSPPRGSAPLARRPASRERAPALREARPMRQSLSMGNAQIVL
eukprot:TRINITY_DN9479_c0_g3_i1.p1 TRINITY_DN9479_c0_g3~~TRINITY_DN9479_c0_g3_i1.p1  ORF type:complete len:664 (-),score=108.74 TRINITY_DN9479_c0_g3_i1:13-1962(-)